MAASALLRSSAASRALWSASVVVCRAVTGTHVLRVDGYSHLSQIANGKDVQSSVFNVAGHSWFLRLYPNGYYGESNSKIHTNLCLASDPGKGGVSAWTKFSILDRLGNPGIVKDTFTKSFKQNEEYCGHRELISREDLEKSEYLQNDGFVIQCDVTVITVKQHRDDMAFIAPNTKSETTV